MSTREEAWSMHCLDMAEGKFPATTSVAFDVGFDAGVREGLRLARAAVSEAVFRDGGIADQTLAAIDNIGESNE